MSERHIAIGQLIQYCSSLAGEFIARRNRVRTFVRHNLTSGTANERILRELLSEISAGTLGVTEGFFANPLQGTASKQCDIIVYDCNFPLVYSEAGVKILWPDSGQMLIEVKTSMKGVNALHSAIANIVSAKRTESVSRLVGCVFAFDALLAETALAQMKVLDVLPQHRPVAVFFFDEGAFIQQSDMDQAIRYGGSEAPYELRRCQGDNPSALALTYLLLFFLTIQFRHARSIGHANEAVMATHQFLERYTNVA